MTQTMLKKKDWSREKRRALNPTEVVTRLAALSGWALSGDGDAAAIEKTFTFANYYETISFVNALAYFGGALPLVLLLSLGNSPLVVALNGETVSEINLDKWTDKGKRADGSSHKFTNVTVKDLPRSGFLGFQDHGQDCWYKNVRIKNVR